MGNQPSGINYDTGRPGMRLTKEELDEQCKPSGHYDSCPWRDEAVRRLIRDGHIAKRTSGTEVQINEDDIFCPICLLYHTDINKTKCCSACICTECYLQARPQKLPKHSDTGRIFQIACPFCKNNKKKFKVVPHSQIQSKGIVPSIIARDPNLPVLWEIIDGAKDHRQRRSLVMAYQEQKQRYEQLARIQRRNRHVRPMNREHQEPIGAVAPTEVYVAETIESSSDLEEAIAISQVMHLSTAASNAALNHSSVYSPSTNCSSEYEPNLEDYETQLAISLIESGDMSYDNLYLLEEEVNLLSNVPSSSTTTSQLSHGIDNGHEQHSEVATRNRIGGNSTNDIESEFGTILQCAMILSLNEQDAKETEERRLILEEVEVIKASTSSVTRVGATSVMPVSEEEQLRLAIQASIKENQNRNPYDSIEGYMHDIYDTQNEIHDSTFNENFLPSAYASDYLTPRTSNGHNLTFQDNTDCTQHPMIQKQSDFDLYFSQESIDWFDQVKSTHEGRHSSAINTGNVVEFRTTSKWSGPAKRVNPTRTGSGSSHERSISSSSTSSLRPLHPPDDNNWDNQTPSEHLDFP